ncbi:MAG TPA: YetF domain-containing protein [Gemmatimonadales bacterium]|jgi:uncharacterized membrane protein YcaP (DUF421 family)|nr:YetF domain-containing protein [Gemmatimonadales bacterium]
MSGTLQDLATNLLQFGTGTGHVSLAEKIVRPIAVYVLLVIALRLMGRRVLAQMNAFDLVVLLLISNTVQNAIIGNDTSLSGGLIGGLALLAINALVIRLLWLRPDAPLRGEGRSVLLWRAGHPEMKNLDHYRITIPELLVTAHERGFDSLSEVDAVTLAPNGILTFASREGHSEAGRHREIMERLASLQRDVAELMGRSPGASGATSH